MAKPSIREEAGTAVHLFLVVMSHFVDKGRDMEPAAVLAAIGMETEDLEAAIIGATAADRKAHALDPNNRDRQFYSLMIAAVSLELEARGRAREAIARLYMQEPDLAELRRLRASAASSF